MARTWSDSERRTSPPGAGVSDSWHAGRSPTGGDGAGFDDTPAVCSTGSLRSAASTLPTGRGRTSRRASVPQDSLRRLSVTSQDSNEGALSRVPAYVLESTEVQNEGKHVRQALVVKHLLPKVGSLVLHPNSSPVRTWNLIILVILLIEAPLLPLQLAFIPDQRLLQLPWIFWLRLWVELVLCLDMAMQFFVQIQPDDRTFWITDLQKIAWMYFRTRFFFDILAVLPITGLMAAFGSHSSGPCVISLVGFHRLLRFARWQRAVTALEGQNSAFSKLLDSEYTTKQIGRATVLVLFSAHVMGCLWATLAVCSSEEDISWYEYLGSHSRGNDLHDGSLLSIYVCGLYWAVYTLTGTGYGNIVPHSPLERTVAILCMMIASLTWAWFVATIVSVIGSMQQSANDHLQTLDSVNELLANKNANSAFCRRFREYFTKLKDVRQQDSVRAIIDEMSPELRTKVVHAVHGAWIDKVWWLKRMPSEFVVDLTNTMQATLHPPNECIPKRPELTIVRRGMCLRGGRLVTVGQLYGEDLLLDSEALRQPYTTFVLTFLHVLVITKASLEDVLLSNPEVWPSIRKAHVIYIVMRGMRLYAEKYKSSLLTHRKTGTSEGAAQGAGWASEGLPEPLFTPAAEPPPSRLLCCQSAAPARRASVPDALYAAASAKYYHSDPLGRLWGASGSHADLGRDVVGEIASLNGLVDSVGEHLRSRLRGVEGLADLLAKKAQLLNGMV